MHIVLLMIVIVDSVQIMLDVMHHVMHHIHTADVVVIEIFKLVFDAGSDRGNREMKRICCFRAIVKIHGFGRRV